MANSKLKVYEWDWGNIGRLGVVGVYRPSDQVKSIDEAVFQQQEVLWSEVVILLGTSATLTSGTVVWQAVGDPGAIWNVLRTNFLSQVIGSSIRGYAMLNHQCEWTACLSCSHHVVVEFTLFRNFGQTKIKIRKLNIRKASFQLFRKLVSKTPWNNLSSRIREQSWKEISFGHKQQ